MDGPRVAAEGARYSNQEEGGHRVGAEEATREGERLAGEGEDRLVCTAGYKVGGLGSSSSWGFRFHEACP